MRVRVALLVLALGLLACGLATTGSSAPAAPTHSGGLDYRGGHHCWTSCSRYGLYTGQYHCHRSPCSRSDIRRHKAHGH